MANNIEVNELKINVMDEETLSSMTSFEPNQLFVTDDEEDNTSGGSGYKSEVFTSTKDFYTKLSSVVRNHTFVSVDVKMVSSLTLTSGYKYANTFGSTGVTKTSVSGEYVLYSGDILNFKNVYYAGSTITLYAGQDRWMTITYSGDSTYFDKRVVFDGTTLTIYMGDRGLDTNNTSFIGDIEVTLNYFE